MGSVRRGRAAALSAVLMATVLTATMVAGGVAADTGDSSPEPTPAPSPSVSEPAEPPTPAPSPTPSPSSSPTETEGVVDDYIVVVRNGAYINSIKDKTEELGGEAGKELRGAVDGFSARLTEENVEALEADPNVEYVEPDEVVGIDGAVSGYVDCNASSMSAIDDGAIGPVDVGFSVNWFGTSYSSIYINNNGGFVFNDGGGGFTAYRGIDLQTATRPYVLPLFTDIDTRYTDGVVTFGPLDNANPSAGFCINWIDVGEYQGTEEDYSFQVIVTNLGAGQIDLEFNYDRISVPTNSSNSTFEVGYTAGDQVNFLVLADSTEPSATVANRLLANKFPASCTVAGRYIFEIRSSGTPTPGPTPTEEPVTPDPTPSPTQTPATWGLDRIDQTALPLNNTYITPTSSTAGDNYGQGVVVYVVDTGVRYTHQEFGNRARKNEAIKGIDEVNNDTDPNDCNGHGTHVAGTIAGSTYGVAKLAEIVGVRVLDCFGSGYTSDVVAGLNAIPAFHSARYGSSYRAVVNMSLGGSKSISLNAAVKSLADAHIPVVVAAGNENADAADYSPASEATAITVGASTNVDARAFYSNYGPSVDIFAPGSSITSAWYTSNTAIYTASGTSMASPHVAGAVALYLGLNSTSPSSPSNTQIAAAITGKATMNALNLNSPPTSTANKLLNVSTYATPLGVYTSPRMASLSPLSEVLNTPTEMATTRLPRSLIETRCTGRDSGGSPTTPPSSSPPSGGGGGGGSSSPEPSGGGGAALEDEITVTQPPLVTNQVSGSGEFKIIDSAGNPVQLSAAGLTPNGLVVRGSGWQVESSGPLTANNTTLQPGQTITIRGSGLQRLTTAGVYILSEPTWVAAGIVSYENEFATSFMVPALAPGQHTLQINTVRQGQAPVSIAVGFTLAAGSVSTSASETKSAASSTKSLFVPFANKSAVLTATAKKRINTALTALGAVAPKISLTGYSTTAASPASVKLAGKRMRAINAYVKSIGFGQQVTYVPAKAARTAQTKGVLIRATG